MKSPYTGSIPVGPAPIPLCIEPLTHAAIRIALIGCLTRPHFPSARLGTHGMEKKEMIASLFLTRRQVDMPPLLLEHFEA